MKPDVIQDLWVFCDSTLFSYTSLGKIDITLTVIPTQMEPLFYENFRVIL